MRKIEKEMLLAIHQRRTWGKGNTRVEFVQGEGESSTSPFWCNVYLHGNHIAELVKDDDSETRLDVNLRTLNFWPTVTTKSRLRALGAKVQTKAHVTYLDGVAV